MRNVRLKVPERRGGGTCVPVCRCSGGAGANSPLSRECCTATSLVFSAGLISAYSLRAHHAESRGEYRRPAEGDGSPAICSPARLAPLHSQTPPTAGSVAPATLFLPSPSPLLRCAPFNPAYLSKCDGRPLYCQPSGATVNVTPLKLR
ncbi:hypothetical protein SKAU_G00004400 [Synaphobranchus kaupii]|uniref:Uncharacterized protein n=1 Tax=Synaphobranchus kaupii TaxID=118154 RepID=A0A9Q1JCQ4_SYNKA|nr:hypothetical protein SKAU_G00004400 [Synaphobranchus kaupii]